MAEGSRATAPHDTCAELRYGGELCLGLTSGGGVGWGGVAGERRVLDKTTPEVSLKGQMGARRR